MLERIAAARDRKGINLFFKPDSNARDIFEAITLSLWDFYNTAFLDELVDMELVGSKPEAEGCSSYWLDTTKFEEVKARGELRKWTHMLCGTYWKYNERMRHMEQKLLGFIDVFNHMEKPQLYTPKFCIGDSKNPGGKFAQNQDTSEEHARRYIAFISNLRNPPQEPTLYIIMLETTHLGCFDSYTNHKALALLMRKLSRQLGVRINYPIVLLGSDNTMINNRSRGSMQHATGGAGISQQSADRLFEWIEDPEEWSIVDKLTGARKNTVRTIIYPTQLYYGKTIDLLRQKLEGKRQVVDVDFTL